MSSVIEPLLETLEQYQQQLAAFEQLLVSENNALSKEDEPALLQTTQDKSNAVKQIEQLDKRVVDLLRVNNANAFEEILNTLQGKEKFQLEQRWRQVQNLAAKVKRQNTMNGVIINNRLNMIARTLELLNSGQDADYLSYSAKGAVLVSQSQENRGAV